MGKKRKRKKSNKQKHEAGSKSRSQSAPTESVLKRISYILPVVIAICLMGVKWAVPWETSGPIKWPFHWESAGQKRRTVFEFTDEHSEDEILNLLNQITEEDRLLVMVLDYGHPDDPSAGSLWLRWEKITMAMSMEKSFQMYEEWERPLVVRMNCSDPFSLCKETLAGKPNKVLIWTPGGKPITMRHVRKSDRSILNELLLMMQPPVKVLKHWQEITDFIEKHKNSVILFGSDFNSVFYDSAVNLGEEARFGANNDIEIAKNFGVTKDDMPTIILYRDFQASIKYPNDLDDSSKLSKWITKNCVPPFGEYNYETARLYWTSIQVFWVYVDALDDSFEDIKSAIFDEVYPMMRKNGIPGVFSYIDTVSGADMAQKMDLSEYPSVVTLSGKELSPTPFGGEEPGRIISRVVLEWSKNNA